MSPPVWALAPAQPEHPGSLRDLTSPLLTAWLGNFLRVSFLSRRGAWSEEEPQWWGLRRGHRRALQHAGPSSGFQSCRVGGSLLKGSASTRRSACLLPIPLPPNSDLRHSGNGDSVRVTLARASLSFPFLLSTFLDISQVLCVCPGTQQREHETNQGDLK